MDILALCTTLSSLDPPWNSTHCLNGQKVSMYLTMVLFICLCLHWKPEYLSYTDMFSQLKRLVSLISTIKWFYWKKYKYKKQNKGRIQHPITVISKSMVCDILLWVPVESVACTAVVHYDGVGLNYLCAHIDQRFKHAHHESKDRLPLWWDISTYL